MSVLKNKRRVSMTDYEMVFLRYYKDFSFFIGKISLQRQPFVSRRIFEVLNKTQYMLSIATETPLKIESKLRKKRILTAEEYLYNNIQEPLLVLFNAECVEIRKMSKWLDRTREVLCSLDRITGKTYGTDFKLYLIDREVTQKYLFLSNMLRLHKNVIKLAIEQKAKYSDSTGQFYVLAADKALFYLFEAVHKAPKTKEEYGTRKKFLLLALKSIEAINRGAYFSLYQKNKHDGALINRVYKGMELEKELISGLIEKDEIRFSKLK